MEVYLLKTSTWAMLPPHSKALNVGGNVQNPVVHFEIMGKDPGKLTAFYGGAFGWTFASPMGPASYMVADAGAGHIGGGIGACPDGTAGHVTFYVGVPDVAKALEDVKRLGGTVEDGPYEVPGGPLIGTFRDPEGHLIGLTQIPS
jgi:predicted enzyme related to lactoylglutathione lyase